MRNLGSVVLSSLLLAFSACDSDSSSPGADTSPADTAAPDTQADAAADTSPADTAAPDTQADTQADAEPADTTSPDVPPDTQADTGDIAAFDTASLDAGPDTSADTSLPDTASSGACDNATDLATLAASESTLEKDIQTCAFECIATGASCATTCIEREAGFSAGCSACFGEVISCTISNCALQCLDAASAACTTCRDSKCTPAFEACAGVEQP